MCFKTYRGFTLLEVMVAMLIIGILAAIAIPSYLKYIRKARVSEAVSNLTTISTYERTYYNVARHYLCLTPNPTEVPKGGQKLEFDPDLNTGSMDMDFWQYLGNVTPQGTMVSFQYRGWAGRFDSTSNGTLAGGLTCLGVNGYTTKAEIAKSAYAPTQACAGSMSPEDFGIPVKAYSDFFYITAVADQDSDDKCSLFAKVIDRPDIYIKDQIE